MTPQRMTGAFFTPDHLVHAAWRFMDRHLPPTWRQQPIYDPACGTGNLLTGLDAGPLFASTLEPFDVAATAARLQAGVVFQYDFLSECGLDSAPPELRAVFEAADTDPLIFMNPPYGASGTFKTDGSHKRGIANTAVGAAMREVGLGRACRELSMQFWFKLINLVLIYRRPFWVGAFTKIGHLTGESERFRALLSENARFIAGFAVKASEFTGLSDKWPIMFGLYRFGETAGPIADLPLVFAEKAESGLLRPVCNKTIYNCDTRRKASEWVREGIPKRSAVDAPQLSSACVVKPNGRGRMLPGALGYFLCDSNNVFHNDRGVALFTSAFSHGAGVPIGYFLCNSNNVGHNDQKVALFTSAYAGVGGIPFTNTSLARIVALFTARATVKGNHIQDQDMYLAPDEVHPDYEQWNRDALIFSIFHPKSQQSSLRNVQYKGRTWQIPNNFFWLPRAFMRTLATDLPFSEMLEHISESEGDPLISCILPQCPLSEDAKGVLTLATELLVESFPDRISYMRQRPDRNLDAFDAGWAQIKYMLTDTKNPGLKEFNKRFAAFGQRMTEGVYKFKFLIHPPAPVQNDEEF